MRLHGLKRWGKKADYGINIDFLNDYNTYLADSKKLFFDRINLINKNLGDYIYTQYQILKFIDVLKE
jgi:hypothetical protein